MAESRSASASRPGQMSASLLSRWASIQPACRCSTTRLPPTPTRPEELRLCVSVTQSAEGGVSAGLDQAAPRRLVETPEAFTFIAPCHGSACRSSFPPVAKTTAATCKCRLRAWLPWGRALQHATKTWSATEDLQRVRGEGSALGAAACKCQPAFPTFKP